MKILQIINFFLKFASIPIYYWSAWKIIGFLWKLAENDIRKCDFWVFQSILTSFWVILKQFQICLTLFNIVPSDFNSFPMFLCNFYKYLNNFYNFFKIFKKFLFFFAILFYNFSSFEPVVHFKQFKSNFTIFKVFKNYELFK